MIVTKESVFGLIDSLISSPRTTFGVDVETTGLLESDSLFSLIVSGDEDYYFNFNPIHDHCLPRRDVFERLKGFFSRPDLYLFLQNAKFDMRMLAKEGIDLVGTVHCTHAVERVIKNNYFGKEAYSLAGLAVRRGWFKDDKVKEYVSKNKLYTKVEIPGKKKIIQLPHYDKVPLEVMAPYGCQDGRVTLNIGTDQVRTLVGLDHDRDKRQPPWSTVAANEIRFTKTAFRMERRGVKIDKPLVAKALEYEMSKVNGFQKEFLSATGEAYQDSAKLFQKVFDAVGEPYPTTEKGNPSFKADVLEEMDSPIAAIINNIRHHEKRAGTYYSSFLYYAGDGDIIHPDVRQAGTETGRCSYRDPNLQNVPKEDNPEDQATLYHVRESFVPRPGHFFYSVDYKQQEFRMMLDYAGEMRLIKAINEGADVHTATAELCGITRKQAKTINFGLLYGMGIQKLAKALGITVREANELKLTYFGNLPRVQKFIRTVIGAGESRGYIHNAYGRRNFIGQKDWAYILPNHLIQGGAADTIKIAQNRIDDMLIARKSPTMMLLQVHDELLFETPFGDERIIEPVKEIMESVYPSQNGMRLDVSIEHSLINWGYRNKVAGVLSYGKNV
jgi:DNA polymerase I-like protein with 3'-5' exonuclease and polymerase domains